MQVLQRSSTKAEAETPPSSGAPFNEELVIKEARRRQRRRWLGFGLAVIVIVGVILLLTIPGGRTPTRARPTAHLPSPQPPAPGATASRSSASASLPLADLFNQITVANGQLLLSGEVDSPSVVTAMPQTCISATVNPETLQIGPSSEANCNDPALDGETVGIVNNNVPDSNNATISIARVIPGTSQASVGPVVMTYGYYSDTRPVMAYGGGWLWIYDSATTSSATETLDVSNPGTPELLQVSASTGQVLDTVTVPNLSRPVLAANDAGLWMGNSIQGAVSPAALYFVAPGSHSADIAISDPTSPVCWLLGSDESLWIGLGERANGCLKQTILRFDGTDFQPVFQVRDEGYHPNTVIGDESDGLWTMQWTNPGSSSTPSPQEIVGINPDTGAESIVATLPPHVVPLNGAGVGLDQGQAVVLDGSLYLLEPPFRQGGYLGYSTLVRVKLP